MSTKATAEEKGSKTGEGSESPESMKKQAPTKKTSAKEKAPRQTKADKDAAIQEELTLRKENSRLSGIALDAAKSRISTLETELFVVRKAVDTLTAGGADLINQAKLAKQRSAELLTQKDAALAQVEPFKKEAASLSRRLAEADKQTAANKAAYEEEHRKIGPLEQKISALEGSFPMLQKGRDKSNRARDAALESVREERDRAKKFKADLEKVTETYNRLVTVANDALAKVPDGPEAAALKEALPRTVKGSKKVEGTEKPKGDKK